MAEILVIAAATVIEALMVDLVELAGHGVLTPAPGEPRVALTRRADAILLDASLPLPLRDVWEGAAGRAGLPIVFFASTMSEGELVDFARTRRAASFSLPNGPRRLTAALDDARAAAEPGGGGWSACPRTPPAPADESVILEAVLTVARARLLTARAAMARQESRALRADREALLAEARASQAALREAVRLYARVLRDRGTSEEQALRTIQDALCPRGASDAPDDGLWTEEARRWVAEIYRAA